LKHFDERRYVTQPIDVCQYIDMAISLNTVSPCCVFDAALSDTDAERIAASLKALADPVRVRLVSLLATAPTGEICACDLPEVLGKSQPTVSHHLSQLVSAGLVHREQRGKWAWFTLQSEVLAMVRAMLGEGAVAPIATKPSVLFL
jgi:ArsR family transcriptional regulator, arsenate/arsenite/antimonite-responsive transcriptional repressor